MDERYLLIRGDDLGVTHAANEGFRKFAQMGVLSGWSIMAPCPWFMEAVALAKEFPEVDLGMHLTLMSEWEGYRWSPVLGAARVPSLVDKNGYFYSDPIGLILANPSMEELEAELRAQVERALDNGLNVRYIDNGHGNLGVMVPRINKIFNKLIDDYNLEVSTFNFDPTQESINNAPLTPEAKLKAYGEWLALPDSPPVYRQRIVHPMEDTPEQRALKLSGAFDIPFLQGIIFQNLAEVLTLPTQAFKDEVKKTGHKIIHFNDLKEEDKSHHLDLWPVEITQQMFAIMGTSPETIEKIMASFAL